MKLSPNSKPFFLNLLLILVFFLGGSFADSSLNALAPPTTKKDEFVFNNTVEPETLDPHVSSGVYANQIIIQTFEGLMARKADWESLTPGQAERYELSKDQKTYTFFLRKNLKWSDGSPLTAKDFYDSWLRAMRPSTLNSLSYWLTDHIVGAKAYSKNPNEETVKKVGLRVLDKYTFQVRLKSPLAYFLQLTALAALFPVKMEVVKKHGDQWYRPKNIVSNGPFVLKEWKVREKIVLEKNPYYHDAKSVRLNRVIALPIEDRQTAVRLYKQGRLDWTGLNGAPNGLVPVFKKDSSFRVSPGFVSYFYRFNTLRPPLNDKRVRQALSLAIDRNLLVKKITRGGESPASAFVPENLGHYKSPPGIIGNNYTANLKKAQQLLKSAGYPDGKGMRKIVINYNTDENNKRVALAIQQMWKEGLGIPVGLFNQEWKVHLKTQESLNYDVSRNGWAGFYPDPSAFLEVFTSQSHVNQTGWKNSNYDELFYKANRLPAGASRRKTLQKAEAILLEESPLAPIYTYVNFGFLRPEVRGFKANRVDRPFARYIYKK